MPTQEEVQTLPFVAANGQPLACMETNTVYPQIRALPYLAATTRLPALVVECHMRVCMVGVELLEGVAGKVKCGRFGTWCLMA